MKIILFIISLVLQAINSFPLEYGEADREVVREPENDEGKTADENPFAMVKDLVDNLQLSHKLKDLITNFIIESSSHLNGQHLDRLPPLEISDEVKENPEAEDDKEEAKRDVDAEDEDDGEVETKEEDDETKSSDADADETKSDADADGDETKSDGDETKSDDADANEEIDPKDDNEEVDIKDAEENNVKIGDDDVGNADNLSDVTVTVENGARDRLIASLDRVRFVADQLENALKNGNLKMDQAIEINDLENVADINKTP